MVHRRAARSAARRYAGDHVDVDDPNDRRERALAEDEVYQSLAVALEQLDVMDIHEELPRHESTFANSASKNLRLALEERAATVLDDFDDGDSRAGRFDPSEYDDLRAALDAAPNGYDLETLFDYFDPVVEADEEVTPDA